MEETMSENHNGKSQNPNGEKLRRHYAAAFRTFQDAKSRGIPASQVIISSDIDDLMELPKLGSQNGQPSPKPPVTSPSDQESTES